MTAILITPHALKTGDIVIAHGGKFRVTADPRESQGHRPRAGHLEIAHGPCDCVVVKAECIEGGVPGYFWVGSDWTFQGNYHARVALAV